MPAPRRAAKRVKYVESDDGGEDDSSAPPPTPSDEEDSGSDFAAEDQDGDEDDEDEQDSDEDASSSSDEDVTPRKKKRGKGAAAASSVTPTKRAKPGKAAAKGAVKSEDDDDDEDDDDSDGYVGGEIISSTKLVPAPSLRHQAGQLGRPVIDFMGKLAQPKYNDREWFHANERVWKWVKQDWDDFATHFLDRLMEEVDETVPWMPAKDLVYRIHRDVRFSNDKTPYKRTLMATFSRGGRKGPFAGYHVCVRAGGESGLHAGVWCPPPQHLNAVREHIKEETDEFKRFKEIIEHPTFVEVFGAPKPDPAKKVKGSMWGRDELKNAPKGVDKAHPHIHLLRLKTFCVSRYFSDLQVVDESNDDDDDNKEEPKKKKGSKKSASTTDNPIKAAKLFEDKCVAAARLAKDFVEILNEMMHPAPPPPPGLAAAAAAGAQ